MAYDVYLYARVSSVAQRERETIASQLRALRDYARARGWRVVAEFKDDGVSAATGNLGNRTGLLEMLDKLSCVSSVVVLDVDRLTRTDDLIEYGEIMGRIQRAGVRIAAVSTGVEHEPNDLAMKMKAHFAAEWMAMHRERVIRGKREATRRGKKSGGTTPYGYRYDALSGQWRVDEAEAAVIREAYRRVAAGESTGLIAADFHARGLERHFHGEWTRSEVWRLVSRTTYVGDWMGDKQQRIMVKVPAIVSRAERDAALAVIGRPEKRGISRVRHPYLCDGISKCAVCGGRMVVVTPVGDKPGYYWCTNRRSMRAGVDRCPLPMFPIEKVDAAVWGAITKILSRPDALAVALEEMAAEVDDGAAWSKDIQKHESHVARLEKVAASVLARFRRGLMSEAVLDAELAANSKERSMVERQIETARVRLAGIKAAGGRALEMKAAIAKLQKAVSVEKPEDRREVVRSLIDGVHHSVVMGPARGEVEAFVNMKTSAHPLAQDYSAQREKAGQYAGVTLRISASFGVGR